MIDSLDSELEQYPFFVTLSKKTRISRGKLLLLTIPLVFTVVALRLDSGLLCEVVGFVYPAWATLRAIRAVQLGTQTREAVQMQWMTYWLCYNGAHVLEQAYILRLATQHVVPLYEIFKLTILVWMFLPSSLGAHFVYANVFCPFFKSHALAGGS